MPAIQTTYSERISAGQEGLIANHEPCRVVTRIINDAGGVGFGKVVSRHATIDNAIISPPASGSFVGITVRNPTVDPDDADKYPQGTPVSILLEGVIWVVASVAVLAGEAAYYVPATGVITNVPTSNTAIPGAIFDADAGIGALVPLRVRM